MVLFDLYDTYGLLGCPSSTEEDTTSKTSSSSDEEVVFLPASTSTDVPELILLNLFDF